MVLIALCSFPSIIIHLCVRAVIDSLDSMKKGKENYAAREAIKFLECSLQEGAKMVRAQADDETLTPGRKKPPKMDLDTWCVNYCHTYSLCVKSGNLCTWHTLYYVYIVTMCGLIP